MTLHVRPRLIFGFIMFAAILLLWSAAAIAQPAASTPATTATPTLAERLDSLAAEIERNRIDLHVPGIALAIVRGDEVIFARGFGLADVSKKTPVTPIGRRRFRSATRTVMAWDGSCATGRDSG